MNRKAILVSEALEIILAAAAIILLLILFAKLLAPSYDYNDETAKSYLGTLQNELKKTDQGNKGAFSIWLNGRKGSEDAKMFLVYFGNTSYLNYTSENKDYLFLLDGRHINYICMCYATDKTSKFWRDSKDYIKTKCSSCKQLSSPARYISYFGEEKIWTDKGQFVINKETDEIGIIKKSGEYQFGRSFVGYCKGDGEVLLNDGSCVCNTGMGYTSRNNPGKSNQPPCINSKSSIYLIDSSLKQGNADYKGFCAGYYNLAFCQATKQYSQGGLGLDLCNDIEANYSKNSKGYYERVHILMKNSSSNEYLMTRKDCLAYAESEAKKVTSADQTAWMDYFIFYTDWSDARGAGYKNDAGYCIYKGDNISDYIIYSTGAEGRKECDNKNSDKKLLFLVTEKGSMLYEQQVTTHYSSNTSTGGYFETNLPSPSTVESFCNKVAWHDLTFIKGEEQGKDMTSSCSSEITWLAANNKVTGHYYIDDIPEKITANSGGVFDNIPENKFCCYASKIT